jgi:hypothetical protein
VQHELRPKLVLEMAQGPPLLVWKIGEMCGARLTIWGQSEMDGRQELRLSKVFAAWI